MRDLSNHEREVLRWLRKSGIDTVRLAVAFRLDVEQVAALCEEKD